MNLDPQNLVRMVRAGEISLWLAAGLADGHGNRSLASAFELVANDEAQRRMADWLDRARYAASLPADEPWPAWSAGEMLAVALILNDTARLEYMEYTRDEAIDRLRFDLGTGDLRPKPISMEDAARVFDLLSEAVR